MIKQEPVYLLAVIPKKAFLDWLRDAIKKLGVEFPREIKFPDEKEFYLDCLLFVVPPVESTEAFNGFIDENYKKIFINCMTYWCEDLRLWPIKHIDEVTLEFFKQFFELELHSRVYNLTERE